MTAAAPYQASVPARSGQFLLVHLAFQLFIDTEYFRLDWCFIFLTHSLAPEQEYQLTRKYTIYISMTFFTDFSALQVTRAILKTRKPSKEHCDFLFSSHAQSWLHDSLLVAVI